MFFLVLINVIALSKVTAQHNLTPFGRATQISIYGNAGPENAINPPISNVFSFNHCTHTFIETTYAWWMFEFSFELAYITDVIIYYRENLEIRMDGFKLYVTNTSTIPPDGYLCYEDPAPGLPNITQSIPCNQFGKFIIYYDDKGSQQYNPPRYDGPVVELCYVAINGCPKGFWGSKCEQNCSTNCIDRHCNPTNGSCVWGCKERRTGSYCSKYNIAYDSLVRQSPSGSQPAYLTTDGNFGSCSKIQGPTVMFQIDLAKQCIVTGVHITIGENNTQVGNHTLYASNTSTCWKCGTILYQETFLPTETNFSAVLRYLTYMHSVKDVFSEIEVCEIGIVGCLPSHYGIRCNLSCPNNCHGPCDLDTGLCLFGCLNGWRGDKCEQACQTGTYGKDCLATCSTNCLNQHCNEVSGECFECHTGWQGFNCTQTCDGGFYGNNCLKICSSFCMYQPCDHGTGECHGGCVCGLQGFNCSQVSVKREEESFPLPAQIGLFIGGFLLGALIAPVVCFLVMKKRQLREKEDKGKDNVTQNSQKYASHDNQLNDNVRMENVSPYEDLTNDSTSGVYDQINTTYVNN